MARRYSSQHYGMSQRIRLHNIGMYVLPCYDQNSRYNAILTNIKDMWVGLSNMAGSVMGINIFLDDGMFKINFYDYTGVNLKIELVE